MNTFSILQLRADCHTCAFQFMAHIENALNTFHYLLSSVTHVFPHEDQFHPRNCAERWQQKRKQRWNEMKSESAMNNFGEIEIK